MLQQISLSSCFVHIIKVKQLKKTLLQSKQDGISTIIVNYNKKKQFYTYAAANILLCAYYKSKTIFKNVAAG